MYKKAIYLPAWHPKLFCNANLKEYTPWILSLI